MYGAREMTKGIEACLPVIVPDRQMSGLVQQSGQWIAGAWAACVGPAPRPPGQNHLALTKGPTSNIRPLVLAALQDEVAAAQRVDAIDTDNEIFDPVAVGVTHHIGVAVDRLVAELARHAVEPF